MDLSSAAVAALCALVATWHLLDLRDALRAPRLGPEPPPAGGPLVSVIVPARDEAARIGACLEGLAAQRYRRFEVLVLDDHSSDGTADLARGFAARLPGLRVLSGRALPPGWGGKSWACWQAAQAARGDLLLFLDADVAPRPELLGALAGRAAAGCDMVTLVPLIALRSPAERLVLPAFAALLVAIFPFERVNDPAAPEAFAIGQCILMRRAAYDLVGGHAAVRGSVLEDMELARLVKAAGLRLEARRAPALIGVQMYSGWGDLAEGLTKNAVAGASSGGWRAAWCGARLGLMAALPFDLLLAGAWLVWTSPEGAAGAWLLGAGGLLFALGWLCWGVAVRLRHGVSAAWGALMPLGVAVYFGLAAAAALRVRSGRGVTWKGRVFPG